MHEHSTCNHDLKYCAICNVVYCEKCNSEWYKKSNNWVVSYPSYTVGDSTVFPANAEVKYYEPGQSHTHAEE